MRDMIWPAAGESFGNRLSFLHLSDIHFSRSHDERKWDLDSPIRRALSDDAVSVVDEAGGISAILVTGDIAFSGQAEEFETAAGWLDALCERIGVPHEDVWVVPGNHDVDRTLVRHTVGALHKRLRECPLEELDRELEASLKDAINEATPLLAPLSAYNAFASQYDCAITGEDPYWQREFELAPDYRLLLRGLTTVFVSDDLDDDGAGRMVLGSVQTRPEVGPGDILMTLGHHPVGWLRDGDRVAAALGATTTVQLWGHRHTQSAANVDGSLQIFAGAVQPYRNEPPWEPRYNLLSFRLHAAGDRAVLKSELRSRMWLATRNRFIADEGGRFGYPRVDDLPVRTTARSVPNGGTQPVTDPEQAYPSAVREGAALVIRNRARRLGFRFARLPYSVRLQVLRDLDLVAEDEQLLPDQELFRTGFLRATERNRLAALWSAVEEHQRDPLDVNPFVDEE